MTRSEFRQAAGEAGVNPNIYGLIIDECMYCKGYSRVTGGKVVGIKWNEEWVTKKETYRPFALINGPTHTALGKVPYVVLKKGNHTYEVEIWKVMGYLNDLFNKFLIDMGKAQAKGEKGERTGCQGCSIKRKEVRPQSVSIQPWRPCLGTVKTLPPSVAGWKGFLRSR